MAEQPPTFPLMLCSCPAIVNTWPGFKRSIMEYKTEFEEGTALYSNIFHLTPNQVQLSYLFKARTHIARG